MGGVIFGGPSPRGRLAPTRTAVTRIAIVLAIFVASNGCAPAVSPSTLTQADATVRPSVADESPGSSSSPSTKPSPSPSGTPYLADPVTLVGLSGQAPAALAIDGATLWAYDVESGDLSAVDTVAGRETGSIHFGGLGSHVVRGADRMLYVARFDTAGSPADASGYLLQVDPRSGAISTIKTGPLGALARAPDGSLLALEKPDRLLRIEPRTRKIVGSARVDIDDEHMEVVAVGREAFVSSDHTPLRRIALGTMKVTATIDVGGGIPFVVRDGLVWGARPDAIWALDPKTNRLVRTIPLDDVSEILAMDIDGTDAWIGVRRDGTGYVLRIDLNDGHLVGHHLRPLPAAIRILGDRVWVADYLENEVDAFPR